MVDKLDIIDDYLRTLGVNKNIINYMRERRIYLNKYFNLGLQREASND